MYKQWCQNALNFLKSIEPIVVDVDYALPDVEIEYKTTVGQLIIPDELIEFYSTGAKRFSFGYFSYEHDLHGSFNLVEYADLPGALRRTDEWATAIEGESPSIAQVWRESIPFCSIKNGDFLGIRCCKLSVFPVVYLDHEVIGTKVIANSLPSFLDEWAKLLYVGPEYWEWEEFVDEETGLLNSELGLVEMNRRLQLFQDSQ